MLAKGHVAMGLATYSTAILAISTLTPETLPGLVSLALGVAGTVIGNLLPDIDTQKSVMGRMAPSVSAFMSKSFEHRTVTHNLLFSLSFFVLALLINGWFFWSLAIGVFLHILVDSFSWQGVLWQYPFVKWHYYRSGGQYKKGRPYHKGYKVGGKLESILYQGCWVYLIIVWTTIPFWLVY